MQRTPARFWMVARSPRHPGAKTAPTTRYGSLSEARRAAQDLANQSDAPFVVLGVEETVWPDTAQPALL